MSEDKTVDKTNFQAEVQQLLNLVIHSLYSEKEVFLRELISNASDACGRLHFESLTNPEMLESEHSPMVEIEFAKRGRIMKIRDNGIGMTREEVEENIGTIARSGTKHFVEALTGEQSEDANLIGQFGVGFYSVFMVAEDVTLETRKAGTANEEGVVWKSDGVSGYTVENTSRGQHGTEITLKLRKDAKEFLESSQISQVVKKYADHISVPIQLREITSAKQEDEEWQVVNDGSALWTRSKKDISDEEYDNFYRSLTYDFEKPLVRLHNRVEGRLEYSSLLFIPSRAPFDLWNADRRQRGIKLYVRRVFIADDTDNLMPTYLSFVRGVIDSDDLPLNVSREFLQKNKQIDRIRAGSVRKVLGELKRLATKDEDKFETFWKEFGQFFKHGIVEDPDNRKAISELMRFATTKSQGDAQTVTLQQYVDRMHEKQQEIYYLTADSHTSAKSSPHLEVFNKHDIEVLLMSDPVDEWVVMHLFEFADKKLKSIAMGDLSLDWLETDQEADQETGTKYEPLIEKLKNSLGERIADVKVTSRLTNSPACLVASDGGMSRNLNRLLAASGQKLDKLAPNMEINPNHQIIQRLIGLDENFDDWAHVLFDQAALSEGATLDDPADYVRRVNVLLSGQSSVEGSTETATKLDAETSPETQ